MADQDRRFLESPLGFATIGVAALAVLVLVVVFVWRAVNVDDPTTSRMFMDAGTSPPTPFRAALTVGMAVPIKAPSGGNTGFPAETCFWTKDGQTKTDPTYVLVNQAAGRPGPTFCPDCGRLVTVHNPAPDGKRPPPPTQAEYLARHKNDKSSHDTVDSLD